MASSEGDYPVFEIERYFSKRMFNTKHVMCSSNAEPMKMKELLSYADEECKQLWWVIIIYWKLDLSVIIQVNVTPLIVQRQEVSNIRKNTSDWSVVLNHALDRKFWINFKFKKFS